MTDAETIRLIACMLIPVIMNPLDRRGTDLSGIHTLGPGRQLSMVKFREAEVAGLAVEVEALAQSQCYDIGTASNPVENAEYARPVMQP